MFLRLHLARRVEHSSEEQYSKSTNISDAREKEDAEQLVSGSQ